jgi:hypothetical protein
MPAEHKTILDLSALGEGVQPSLLAAALGPAVLDARIVEIPIPNTSVKVFFPVLPRELCVIEKDLTLGAQPYAPDAPLGPRIWNRLGANYGQTRIPPRTREAQSGLLFCATAENATSRLELAFTVQSLRHALATRQIQQIRDFGPAIISTLTAVAERRGYYADEYLAKRQRP